MKNKKGFTLVEMLLTLCILAIISLIVVPNVVSTFKRARDNEYQRFLSDIFLSTEAYVQKNIDKYPNLNAEGNSAYVYVEDLLKSKYLKSSLYDPKNKVKISTENYFTVEVIVKDDGSYTYKLYEELYKPLYISKVTQDLLDNNTTYGNYVYMGGAYLKGVQESNYVWYNGFLWRIMGKNSDGTIKLITEENVTAIPYGNTNQGLLYSTNTGYINDWLNNYFFSNLDSNKTSIIQNSSWCINTTTSSTSVRTDCTGGSTFNAKVGLISLDEYNLSGASETNSIYGLVNSQVYWTLTPYSSSTAWYVNSNSNIGSWEVTFTYGVRPVINVSPDTIISEGNGQLKKDGSGNIPYMLNQVTDSENGKLNSVASSGEYVSLNNRIYRVVSKDNIIGTKLIYDGYYEEPIGTTYRIAYNETSTNVFSTGTGIGKKLNGDVLTWLGNSGKIINSDWYQTNGLGYGIAYTTILNDTSNPINAKVGLIRVGEMLSGQSTSILTNKYTVRSEKSNAKNYWTMNKYTTVSAARYIGYYGYSSDCGVENTDEIRPVIVVSTDTSITSGNGTLQSPYIID